MKCYVHQQLHTCVSYIITTAQEYKMQLIFIIDLRYDVTNDSFKDKQYRIEIDI